MNTEILVCTNCNDWQTKSPHDLPKQLGKALSCNLTLQNLANDKNLNIVPTKCLGACAKTCVVAFRETNKPTYVFGELTPDDATDILKLATIYSEGDGVIQWSDRPECMKRQIVKLPI